MAEFLIYCKIHWMEAPAIDDNTKTGYEKNKEKLEKEVDSDSKTKKLEIFKEKYDSRYTWGDVIEIRDNKGKTEKETLAFALINVPHLSFEDAITYMQPIVKKDKNETKAEKDKKDTILKKRKYWIDMSGVTLDANKEVILTEIEFNNLIKEKNK